MQAKVRAGLHVPFIS